MVPGKQYTPEDGLDIIRRRWTLVVVPLLLGVATTAAVLQFVPNMYRSEAMILTIPQQVPENYVRSTVTTRIDDRLHNMAQQILSRTRLERIIAEFDLYKEERKTEIMEDVVQRMRDDIRVDIAGETTRRPRRPAAGAEASFRVSYLSQDPMVAMKVTERLVNLFIDENLRDRGNLAEATDQFLESQLAEARQQLEQQERRIEQYRRQHLGELPTQVQTNLQAMQSGETQLQSLLDSIGRDRDRRLVLERLLADTVMPDAGVPPGSDPKRGAVRPDSAAAQLDVARAQLAQMQLRLKPQHPEVVKMERTIRELEAKAAQEALAQPVSADGTTPGPVSTQMASARNRLTELKAEAEGLDRRIAAKQEEEKRLRKRIAGYHARLEVTPTREAELAALTRDYDTTRDHYESLLKKKEESRIAANLEARQIGEQLRVVDPPRLPERPESPNRLQLMLLGAAASLALGFALLMVTEYRDSSVRSEGDVLASLALPVLAMIPVIQSEAERRRARIRKAAKVLAFGCLVLTTGAALALTFLSP